MHENIYACIIHQHTPNYVDNFLKRLSCSLNSFPVIALISPALPSPSSAALSSLTCQAFRFPIEDLRTGKRGSCDMGKQGERCTVWSEVAHLPAIKEHGQTYSTIIINYSSWMIANSDWDVSTNPGAAQTPFSRQIGSCRFMVHKANGCC